MRPGSARCDGRPSLACRVAGSRACYRGCENRGPFRSCLSVSPEVASATLGGFERRASGRVPGAPAARISSHGWRGRPTEGPWKRSVNGRLGETGRLGLARPGSAAEGRGDGVVSAHGSSAPGRARRR